MKNIQTNAKSSSPAVFMLAIVVSLLSVNFLFVMFAGNEARTIDLLNNELITLEQDEVIITSSKDISTKFKKEIEQISKVFPNEENIPQFVQTLEGLLKENSDEYTFRFNSVIPLQEQDRLYLPMTVSLKTDLIRLLSLFDKLENLKYMTHINSLTAKTPENFTGNGEVTFSLKVYVQNPFTTK